MRFCSGCGQRLSEECQVCPICGESAETASTYQKDPYDAEKYTHGVYVRRVYARPTLTYAFIIINILVFALIRLIGKDGALASLLSMHRGAVASGQYIRVITSIFTHEDFGHLFSNCYALFIYGMILEPALGKARYSLLYFAGGILGNVLTYAFMDNPSIGASGAIFGLLGAIVAINFVRPTAVGRGMVGNIVLCVVLTTVFGIGQNVNNLAHFGGMLGGYIAACLMIKGRIRKKIYTSRPVLSVLLIVVLLFSTVSGTVKATDRNGLYYGDYAVMTFLAAVDRCDLSLPYAEKILNGGESLYITDALAIKVIDSADKGDIKDFTENFGNFMKYNKMGYPMMSRDIWEKLYEATEKIERQSLINKGFDGDSV